MDSDLTSKISRLKSIADNELSILHILMEDTDFKPAEYAKKNNFHESTIRGYLTSIYKKLDVPDNERDKRGYVVREYGEAYREMFVVKIPSKTKIDVKPPDKRVRPWLIIGGIIGAFFIISVTAITTLILVTQYLNRPSPVIALTQENAISTMVEQLAPSMFPTEVPPTTIPTPQPTPIPPTKIPAFTPTPKPTIPYPTNTVVSIPLPFSDDFSSGANPSWKPLQGTWLVANGRYTKSNTNEEVEISILNDPNWSDYRIKVNVSKGFGNSGAVSIFVRFSEKNSLAFYVNLYYARAGWMTNNGGELSYIVGYIDKHLPDNFDLEVTAIGNEFTAKINGAVVQQIILDGYEKGGVGLGCKCTRLSCASFDNFEITAP